MLPPTGSIAERKLDEWLVKPTDGLFARMNRRISSPISPRAHQFSDSRHGDPVTLMVSFLAGVFLVWAATGTW